MKPTRFLTLLLLSVVVLLLLAADDPPPTTASAETQAELSVAFFQRLQGDEAKPLVFALFTPELDTVFLSPDGETAVLWLALRDDSGRRLATEPGLALATLSEDGWQVILPGDPGWEGTLKSLPEGMLPQEQSPAPADAPVSTNAVNAPLTGYYLPYAAGTSRWLEGSISHFQYIPELGYPSCTIEYCHYAYDFTDVWHFPLLASRRGTVVASRDSCTDGSTSCTNYIVLYNANDQAYQIYLHLAHDTIPGKLTPGTTVQRGNTLVTPMILATAPRSMCISWSPTASGWAAAATIGGIRSMSVLPMWLSTTGFRAPVTRSPNSQFMTGLPSVWVTSLIRATRPMIGLFLAI